MYIIIVLYGVLFDPFVINMRKAGKIYLRLQKTESNLATAIMLLLKFLRCIQTHYNDFRNVDNAELCSSTRV
jgi:hypothetical protein